MPRTRASSSQTDDDKRRWAPTPPLLRDPDGPGPEGLTIVGELASPLGGLLWKTYRSILLWGQTDPEDRAGLFGTGTSKRRAGEIESVLEGANLELREPLDVTVSMLTEPEVMEESRIGQAARRISTWARSHPAPDTEFEFLRVAAAADPTNPHFALGVAEAARDRMLPAVAEAWYFRTIGLARRKADWPPYIEAYLAHGSMMLDRGSIPAARESFLKGFRRATRLGQVEAKARALHSLFTLEGAAGNTDEAPDFAGQAIELLGAGHPELPPLARDLAFFWLRNRYFALALDAFAAISERAPRAELPSILGGMARAAAATPDIERFEEARNRLSQLSGGPGVAEAWLDVARAALQLGNSEAAEAAAGHARRLARQSPGGQIEFLAGVLLDKSDQDRHTRPEPNIDVDGRQSALAERLIQLLSEPG
ncbi:MAG: hypothetical protein EA351_09210 [Gemmatimonadales bacterium]|nr:MAG: hypothetical protein EA351_09210 [Gemmatimonadales bacterium]